MEGRKDRQTLFYRALPATAGGPKRCLLFNSFNLYELKKINVNVKSFVELPCFTSAGFQIMFHSFMKYFAVEQKS